MKNLENLKGAQKLSKNEQQKINGGGIVPCPGYNNYYYMDTPLYDTEAECANLVPSYWYSGRCYFCYN